MKTVREQIFSFLQANPTEHHGGQIQRMNFKTRNGGLATGDSIKRRLNELAEEGLIHSRIENNQAYFSITESQKKKSHSFEEIWKDGRMWRREVIV